MNPPRIVHKNSKLIKKQEDTAFRQWVDELVREMRMDAKKRAEKKYGVNLDHVVIK